MGETVKDETVKGETVKGEKVKNKDAGQANDNRKKDLDEGLEGTFPASDPVSATRQPQGEATKETHRH